MGNRVEMVLEVREPMLGFGEPTQFAMAGNRPGEDLDRPPEPSRTLGDVEKALPSA